MDIASARRWVLSACHELVNRALIARTWGNVSCRVGEDAFVITPSGRAYDTLGEADILRVSLRTLECERGGSGSGVVPSSEKLVHAAAYRARPDVGFIVHTHQCAATAISVAGFDASAPGLEHAALAEYAPAGTRQLADNVSAVTAQNTRSVLLPRHGALLLGSGCADALGYAVRLEAACAALLKGQPDGQADGHAKGHAKGPDGHAKGPGGQMDGRADGQDGPLELAEAALRAALGEGCFTGVLASAEAAAASALYAGYMPPMLEDSCMLLGSAVPCIQAGDIHAGAISRAAQSANALFIGGYGAVCFARTEPDLDAVKLLLQKECICQLNAHAHGVSETLCAAGREALRRKYLDSYSRLIR